MVVDVGAERAVDVVGEVELLVLSLPPPQPATEIASPTIKTTHALRIFGLPTSQPGSEREASHRQVARVTEPKRSRCRSSGSDQREPGRRRCPRGRQTGRTDSGSSIR